MTSITSSWIWLPRPNWWLPIHSCITWGQPFTCMQIKVWMHASRAVERCTLNSLSLCPHCLTNNAFQGTVLSLGGIIQNSRDSEHSFPDTSIYRGEHFQVSSISIYACCVWDSWRELVQKQASLWTFSWKLTFLSVSLWKMLHSSLMAWFYRGHTAAV